MAQIVPQAYRDLLEKPAIAHLATIMPSGVPQVTPVWIDFDGTYLLVNSAVGRQKDKNMQARQLVGLEISDPQNPIAIYRCAVAWWRSPRKAPTRTSISWPRSTRDPRRYTGRAPGEVRRIYKIEPMRIDTRESTRVNTSVLRCLTLATAATYYGHSHSSTERR